MGVALLIPFGAHGCGVQKNEHDEARELLERIARLDSNASFEARDAQLTALDALPLTVPELRAMRTACVAARRGLLQAERGQAEVRARIDADKDSVDVPAMEAALKKAATQHAEALVAMKACEDQMRDATVRYR